MAPKSPASTAPTSGYDGVPSSSAPLGARSGSETQHSRAPAQQSSSQRAKVACRLCNSRRVKCDVSESYPCRNCITRDVTCEILTSRRGKYTRTRTRAKTQPCPAPNVETTQTAPALPSTFPVGEEQNPSRPACLPHTDELRASQCDWRSSSNDGEEAPATPEEGSEMLYARIADTCAERTASESNPVGRRTYYLGETFSLGFVVKNVCSPDGTSRQDRVHYPIPSSVDDSARGAFHDEKLSSEELAVLKAKRVYDFPRKDIGEKLFRAFFVDFFPAYPVFDRREIEALYNQDKLSPLVQNTIYFIASTICEEQLLQQCGFSERSQARTTFYLRAKALYDADQERDKVKLTAVLFLLGFWWNGPEDQKDTWFWLGAAISLGQTLGMHRSTAKSGLSPPDRSLWKRIWWSIYIRDRHTAAALGRPFRIQDEDCNVEPLRLSDFDNVNNVSEAVFGTQEDFHMSYMMEMCKLATLLGRILRAEFAVNLERNPAISQVLCNDLKNWEQELPQSLSLEPLGAASTAPFWARMLRASLNNCQILLYQPRCITIKSEAASIRDAHARAAADSITRIAEDLLSVGALRYGQLHLVPALFAATSVHSVMILRNDSVRAQLAENKARQCMLALSELSKSWPVGGWILQLFINLFKRLTGHEFGFQNVGVLPKGNPLGMESTTIRHENQSRKDSVGPHTMSNDTSDELPNHNQGIHHDPAILQVYAQDLTEDAWLYRDDILPPDFLFQDASGVVSLYDNFYHITSNSTNENSHDF